MSRLILIRHGDTDLAGTFCGQIDPPLNVAGEARMAEVAEAAATLGIARIVASDLARARRTAEIIGARLDLPVEIRPALREIGFGEWEGLKWAEVEARDPQVAQRWVDEYPHRAAPGGEAFDEFIARMEMAFGLLEAESICGPTAVVSHRGLMQFALARLYGYSEDEARTLTAPYGALINLTNSTNLINPNSLLNSSPVQITTIAKQEKI